MREQQPRTRPTGRTVVTAADHCGHPACGYPQNGPGHPRAGWISVHVAGRGAMPDRWYCSWRCVSIAAIRHELGYPPDTAPDPTPIPAKDIA